MIAVDSNTGTASCCAASRPPGGDIVELALLLPREYVSVLERLAEARGTVIARLLRQGISDFLIRELRIKPGDHTQRSPPVLSEHSETVQFVFDGG
jgi:hypothetical protein